MSVHIFVTMVRYGKNNRRRQTPNWINQTHEGIGKSSMAARVQQIQKQGNQKTIMRTANTLIWEIAFASVIASSWQDNRLDTGPYTLVLIVRMFLRGRNVDLRLEYRNSVNDVFVMFSQRHYHFHHFFITGTTWGFKNMTWTETGVEGGAAHAFHVGLITAVDEAEDV